MKLTNEHLAQAITAGLNLLDPDKELIEVYRRHTSGLMILRSLLENIGTGQVVLSSPPSADPDDGDEIKVGGTNPDDD